MIAAKVLEIDSGEVSVGKVSIMVFGVADCSFVLMEFSDSGRRARRATARLPWEGWERIRAIPVPWVVVG